VDTEETAAISRLAINRLEDKLQAHATLVQAGLQTVREDVHDLGKSIATLAEKLDGRMEKHDERIRVLEVSKGAQAMLGLLFSLLIGPGLALLTTLLIWHRGP
jgi:predicted  nucleic acid-binding Zn-ribbon protein